MIFKFGGSTAACRNRRVGSREKPCGVCDGCTTRRGNACKGGMIYENEIRLEKIGFCKIENQQECVAGTLCIPKLLDVLNSRYRMFFL